MKYPVISRNNLFNFSSNNDAYAKCFLALIFVTFLNPPGLNAQELTYYSGKSLKSNSFILPESLRYTESPTLAELIYPDTTFQISKPKLLPDKISFFESWLWGENGLVRGIGLASPLTPEVRRHELDVRRFMLTAHQIGGFVTLGCMLATCYYGQKIIDGDYTYEKTKKKLVTATIASYSITALLSILSPPPLIRRDESSTTSLHKFLAWFHVAGMIVTPLLGSVINTKRMFHMDKAHYHQIAGYITTAIFTTAMVVITF